MSFIVNMTSTLLFLQCLFFFANILHYTLWLDINVNPLWSFDN